MFFFFAFQEKNWFFLLCKLNSVTIPLDENVVDCLFDDVSFARTKMKKQRIELSKIKMNGIYVDSQ